MGNTGGRNAATRDGDTMKIYLLMLLMAGLMIAIRMSQMPEAEAQPVKN